MSTLSIVGIGISIFTLTCPNISKTILLYILLLFAVFVGWGISKATRDRFLIVIFALALPYLTDLNMVYDPTDFHMVSKSYFTFNILHIICIFILIEILKNRKKIHFDYDLLIILLFNLICILSIFYAVNYKAAFFDYSRYFNLTIIYIYFSRIFDMDKNSELLLKYIIIGLVLQLIIGLVQKLIGKPIGLYFLGEGRTVFRTNVSGYEKGMSGTFGHPGPYAIYALFVLSWLIFNRNIKLKMRVIGIITSTSIIILAAGRTSIMLMLIVYICYFLDKFFTFSAKNLVIILSIILLLFLSYILFYNQLQVIINRFTSSDMEMQLNSRLIHVDLALLYIKQKPLFGFGLNNYLDLTHRDFPLSVLSNFFLSNPIHNAYLLYAVEIGIIGMMIFLLFILKGFIQFFKLIKFKSYYKDTLHEIKGYLVATIVYIIYNFQGWGGIKTKILIMMFLTSAFIYNNYKLIQLKENSSVEILYDEV